MLLPLVPLLISSSLEIMTRYLHLLLLPYYRSLVSSGPVTLLNRVVRLLPNSSSVMPTLVCCFPSLITLSDGRLVYTIYPADYINHLLYTDMDMRPNPVYFLLIQFIDINRTLTSLVVPIVIMLVKSSIPSVMVSLILPSSTLLLPLLILSMLKPSMNKSCLKPDSRLAL